MKEQQQAKKIKDFSIKYSTCLGEGSFGKVYLATKMDPSTKMTLQFAVKVFEANELNDDPKKLEFLKREIEIMRQLRGCPYIVGMEAVCKS